MLVMRNETDKENMTDNQVENRRSCGLITDIELQKKYFPQTVVGREHSELT